MIEQSGHVIRYVQTMEYTANAVHGAKILTPGKSIFESDRRSFDDSTSTAKDITPPRTVQPCEIRH